MPCAARSIAGTDIRECISVPCFCVLTLISSGLKVQQEHPATDHDHDPMLTFTCVARISVRIHHVHARIRCDRACDVTKQLGHRCANTDLRPVQQDFKACRTIVSHVVKACENAVSWAKPAAQIGMHVVHPCSVNCGGSCLQC